MPDATIDGKEITFDLERLTITEYRKFANGKMTTDEDDALLARAAGVDVEWLQGLSQPNYRRILKAFFDKARAPLDDPN